MRTRAEIKEIAKSQLAANRSNSIVIYVLLLVVGAAVSGFTLGFGSLLIVPVLMIAASGFYAAVYRGEARSVSDWFSTIFDNYLRKLGGYLWMGLWIFLWALLFYIPGIVKAFSYFMTPYILADCPNVQAKDALRLSMRMTNGYKADIFVAFLSFIGWELLSGLTFGILEVLYVGPYRSITFGGIYQELKENAIANHTIRPEEFEGGPVQY